MLYITPNSVLRKIENHYNGNIHEGDILKVSNGKESFWCITRDYFQDDYEYEYMCEIDNDLINSDYSKGDYIWVKRENVIKKYAESFTKKFEAINLSERNYRLLENKTFDEEIVYNSDLQYIKIKITYPISKYGPSEYEQNNKSWLIESEIPPGGITTLRKQIQDISDIYHDIYAEEDKSKKYGIWGHNLSDLVLHTIEYDAKLNIVSLGVDS